MTIALPLIFDFCSGGGSSPANPNNFTVPPVLWVRADSQALGSVATWTDKSAAAHNLAAAGTQPVNTAASGPKASQPALIWNGTTTREMSVANALVGTTNWTMVIVAKIAAAPPGALSVIASSGSNTTGVIMAVDTTPRRNFTFLGVIAVTDSTNNATANYEAWIFESDNAGNLSLSVNNVTHTVAPSPETAAAPAADFSVGAFGGGTNPFGGAVWEVIVFPTKLPAGDRAQLVAYLSSDTGLF